VAVCINGAANCALNGGEIVLIGAVLGELWLKMGLWRWLNAEN
jgi:hypothetical protein